MSGGCTRAARLSLAALGGHATEAERLELESHLAGCARCSAEHGALGLVRVLRDVEPDELGGPAHERIRRTLLARPPSASPAARRLRWPIALGGGLAAATAAAALFLTFQAPARVARIAGDVQASRVDEGGRGESAWVLHSDRSGQARLADATAALGRSTDLVWHDQRHSVELRAGSVTLDVEHRPGQHFEVRTPRFVVEVIGTRFSVDLDGVRTERGLVSVYSADGRLLAYVEAGKSWAYSPPATTPAPAPAAPPVMAPPPPALAPGPPAPPRESPPLAEPSSRRSPPPESPATRLAAARSALARGDATEARRLVEPAFRLGRAVAAEARALHAESFLVEGRYADAVDGYEILVRDFPATPQAESALYAIAQLESEHGRAAEGRAALARYLDRYPHGRFAKEAADRLARLSAPR